MTASLGCQQPDQMETTLSTILSGIILDEPLPPGSGILRHFQFEKIPISPERQEAIIQGQIDGIVDAIA